MGQKKATLRLVAQLGGKLQELRSQLRREITCEPRLFCRQQLDGLLIGEHAGGGRLCQHRTTIRGRRHPTQVAVRLEPVGQLRDVRPDATVPLGQDAQRQWGAFLDQVTQDAHFRDRQAQWRQHRLQARVEAAGCVNHGTCHRRRITASNIVHT